jgi:hypothetical protein
VVMGLAYCEPYVARAVIIGWLCCTLNLKSIDDV